MPTSHNCPFGCVTVEGIPLRVQSGTKVKVTGVPSGWTGLFQWRVGETRPVFEARISDWIHGQPSPTPAKHAPPRAELAALAGDRLTSASPTASQ
eukprot:3535909-Prymnesium_polylepis.1